MVWTVILDNIVSLFCKSVAEYFCFKTIQFPEPKTQNPDWNRPEISGQNFCNTFGKPKLFPKRIALNLFILDRDSYLTIYFEPGLGAQKVEKHCTVSLRHMVIFTITTSLKKTSKNIETLKNELRKFLILSSFRLINVSCLFRGHRKKTKYVLKLKVL